MTEQVRRKVIMIHKDGSEEFHCMSTLRVPDSTGSYGKANFDNGLNHPAASQPIMKEVRNGVERFIVKVPTSR